MYKLFAIVRTQGRIASILYSKGGYKIIFDKKEIDTSDPFKDIFSFSPVRKNIDIVFVSQNVS
ncbi:MAG: hypothetical protein QJR05_04535 [Thermoanaerobacterium sp.]|nr:hypothetical protein [Thermoanaerobacterium sp.]